MGLLTFGIYGSLHIKVEVDGSKMLSVDSYLSKFGDIYYKEFEENGLNGAIYSGEIAYTIRDFESIDQE
jgi:hypothetical protein